VPTCIRFAALSLEPPTTMNLQLQRWNRLDSFLYWRKIFFTLKKLKLVALLIFLIFFFLAM
jgi:hypothetical protein